MLEGVLLKMTFFITIVFIFIFNQAYTLIYDDIEKYNLYMPNVQPKEPNQYLCSPVKINPSVSYYIVGFEPNASMNTVHHMILYGCKKPGLAQQVWNCGEMSTHLEKDELHAPPCASGSTILYAWARDAPMLNLPDDVAFKAGKGTNIDYLVLQVHYNHVEHLKGDVTDTSGVILHYTENPMPKLAGVLLMGTTGTIEPNSLESMETSCPINEDKAIHPFAFRTHTHELGVRVAGYRVRRKNGVDHWTLIGERNPMDPQMFYEVKEPLIIQKGDVVAAACKMDALERNRVTHTGPTSEDEMCNFYMMYWVEDTAPLEQQYCFSSGPPFYYWNDHLNNIPNLETLPYRKKEI